MLLGTRTSRVVSHRISIAVLVSAVAAQQPIEVLAKLAKARRLPRETTGKLRESTCFQSRVASTSVVRSGANPTVLRRMPSHWQDTLADGRR